MVPGHRVRWRRIFFLGRRGLVRAVSETACLAAVTGNVTGFSTVEAGHRRSRIFRLAILLGASVESRSIVRLSSLAELPELAVDSLLNFTLPFPLFVPLILQEPVQLLLHLGVCVGFLGSTHSVRRSSAVVGVGRALVSFQTQRRPVSFIESLGLSLAYLERKFSVSHRFQEGVLRDDLRSLVGRHRVGQDDQTTDFMQQVTQVFFRALTSVVQLSTEGFSLAFRPVSLPEAFDKFLIADARLSAEVPEKLSGGLLQRTS
jgi:hypothetical protein